MCFMLWAGDPKVTDDWICVHEFVSLQESALSFVYLC